MAADPGENNFVMHQPGNRISGTVDFRGMVIIEGEAEGEITGDNIEIAPFAVVIARITANRLKIGGQVDGELVARERIEVLSTDARSAHLRLC